MACLSDVDIVSLSQCACSAQKAWLKAAHLGSLVPSLGATKQLGDLVTHLKSYARLVNYCGLVSNVAVSESVVSMVHDNRSCTPSRSPY